jgi:hypothetical protein
MRSIKAVLVGLLASATLLLAGCGGGIEITDGYADYLDVHMSINGLTQPNVHVFAGELQTVDLYVGQSFLLDSAVPVAWNVVVNNTVVTGTGNTILAGGATIFEALKNANQYAVTTSGFAPLPIPAQMTVRATSLYYPYEVATINVVIH